MLLDKSIKRLDLSSGDENTVLRADQCARLFEYFDEYDTVGLQELLVKVKLLRVGVIMFLNYHQTEGS